MYPTLSNSERGLCVLSRSCREKLWLRPFFKERCSLARTESVSICQLWVEPGLPFLPLPEQRRVLDPLHELVVLPDRHVPHARELEQVPVGEVPPVEPPADGLRGLARQRRGLERVLNLAANIRKLRTENTHLSTSLPTAIIHCGSQTQFD